MAIGGAQPVAGSSPEGVVSQNEQTKDHAKPAPTPPPPTTTTTTGAAPSAGGEKLSNAELKKRAKEEKAARRQQAKAAQTAAAPPGAVAAAAATAAAAAAAATATKGKSNKQDVAAAQGSAGAGSKMTSKVNQAVVAAATPLPPSSSSSSLPPKKTVPECFRHLSMAKRRSITEADRDVHPTVLQLGQQMGSFAIRDSISRVEATLVALKQVIESYSTPHGATLSRHLTAVVLKQQIEYLAACRPMCFSMGNAIRWLKLQISKVDIDLPDVEARELLGRAIDNYVHERVVLANMVIAKTVADMMARNDDGDGDVIVTYARHHLVERALLRARADGKRFRVIIVDDAFERVGLDLAQRLSAADIPVIYSLDLGALRTFLVAASFVLIAAEAMFSNGAVYARAGTCDVAAVASDLGIRVVALCESINFTDRVANDSLTYNEIDPQRYSSDAFRLLFDTTPEKFISTVITEFGNGSSKSVPGILRKLEEL